MSICIRRDTNAARSFYYDEYSGVHVFHYSAVTGPPAHRLGQAMSPIYPAMVIHEVH